MTADGPDKGTPEYKAAYRIDTFTGATFYYKRFLQNLTDEEKNKFKSQLGDYSKTNTAPFLHFVEMTGPLPQKKADRQKLLKEVHELTKAGYYPYLITYLSQMQEHARYSNLVEAYNKGSIRPELLAILEEEAPFPEEYQALPEAAILQEMLKAGKLDFEPFRHERDIEQNWYNFYRIAFQPLPVIRRSIRRIADTNEFNYRGTIEHLKTQVKILLEGERPTPAMLERTGGKGADTYVIPPVEPEKLISFAELIEGQYQRQVKEKAALDFNAPFTQAIDTGFYINPGTCKITDLRPYQKELHALLSLNSWDYLKDFANAIREAVKDFTEPAKEPGPLSIIAKKTRNLVHAIDKVDENLFAGMFDEKASNQPALFHTVTIDRGKQKGKKIKVTAYIDYEKLPEEIKKELTDYDRRVCEAASAIYNAGNEVTTLTQLYYTMGGTGKPAKKQVEKINQSVTKMMVTLFHLDNKDEIANNINYPKMEYDGPLLPAERVTAIINGKITDAAIHLFREPPLMTFARERKQIYTCSLELLQSPLNISETKLAIEHCLLALLAMGKHDTEKEKKKPEQYRKPVKKEMLLETIYKRAKTTDRRTKPRTKEKIITLLTHYKSKGQIKDFTLTNDRVILEF